MFKTYPVILTKTKDCYLIEVPDLDILTEGKDLRNAIEIARDAILVTIESLKDIKQEIPKPSLMEDIDVKKGTFAGKGEGFVTMVDVEIKG